MTFRTRHRCTHQPRGERGVALLVALFALLLLSAIGLGMMYSADTETSINTNYKDKQAAIYSANSGLEEAKDRLVMSGGDITPPSDIPSLSAQNVLYIINPGSGETSSDIAPWDYSNQYADRELCQEGILGLTRGTPGTPCTGSSSLPSGNGWYHYVDDSTYSGVYHLSPPLNFKWVRVALKTNNMTQFPADGDAYPDSTHAAQVCWDGTHQIPKPTGYDTMCKPNGAITAIYLTNGGSGYTTSPAPTVTISAPSAGGTQATATANVTVTGAGVLTAVTPVVYGSGYSSATPPAVTVTPVSGGSGAVVQANVIPAGAPVASITLNNAGNQCFASGTAPAGFVTISGTGSGATATATMTGQTCIYSIGIQDGGKGCNAGTVTFAGGAQATVTVQGNKVNSITITNPGSGYSSAPASFSGLSCTGGSAKQPTFSNFVLGYMVSGLTLTAGGGGYTAAPSVNFAGGIGSTAPSASTTLGANVANAGQIQSYTIVSGGSGYTTPPTITVAPPTSGTTATAVASTSSVGTVTSISFTPGSGYMSAPTVTIAAPPGAGTTATAVATVQGGSYYSPVIMLTALGQTKTGARALTQMEVAYTVRSLTLPGALTMAGPQPAYGSPNSNNFYISGLDHPTGYGGSSPVPPGCSTTANSGHPAIGVYDNPNAPTSPTSVDTMLTPGVLQPDGTHYPGINGSPDVQNVYGSLGDQGQTPTGMDSLVSAIAGIPGANIYGANPSNIATGSVSPNFNPTIDVVYGDLTLSGNTNGYGVLVVTGTLYFNGNFTWNGIVLVIGQGDIEFGGGGGGTINGSVLIAKTKDPSGNELATLGQPTLNWSGGGGNGIYYDHCWSDGMLNMIPLTVPASPDPLKVLSVRSLPY